MSFRVLYYSQGREEDEDALVYLKSMLSNSLDELSIFYITEEISAVGEKKRRDLAKEQRKHISSVEQEETFSYATSLFEDTSVEIITATAKGDPVKEVEKKLKNKEFDLFALTAFGRGGFIKEILGAHVKPMLKQSKLPILIHKGRIKSCERVLMHVPNDRERCINLSRYMSNMLKNSKPAVTFLSVIEEGHPHFEGYTSPEDEQGLTEVRRDYEEEEREYLNTAREIMLEEGVEAEIRHRIGDLTTELLKEAKEGRYDLMAFAPEKPGVLESLWHGDTSFEVIRDIEISVMKFLHT